MIRSIICIAFLVSCEFVRAQDGTSSNLVGGSIPAREEAAWSVLVNARGYLCRGAIVGRRWILTSATCVFQIDPSYINIVAGAHNLDKDLPDMQFTKGKKVFVPESLNFSNPISEYLQYDVAMIKTTDVIRIGQKFIDPVERLASEAVYEKIKEKKRRCFLYGRGLARNEEGVYELSRQLRKVSMRYVNCKNLYEIFRGTGVDCVRTNVRGESPCYGDVGEGMVCKQYGKWHHVGILQAVDLRDGCRAGFFTVTKTSPHVDFIKDIMDNN